MLAQITSTVLILGVQFLALEFNQLAIEWKTFGV